MQTERRNVRLRPAFAAVLHILFELDPPSAFSPTLVAISGHERRRAARPAGLTVRLSRLGHQFAHLAEQVMRLHHVSVISAQQELNAIRRKVCTAQTNENQDGVDWQVGNKQRK